MPTYQYRCEKCGNEPRQFPSMIRRHRSAQLIGSKSTPARAWPLRIIVGALAQILAFAQQKATAASSGDGGTFLMVAGARSHLYRTRFNYIREVRK
jgi:hypothetical protein